MKHIFLFTICIFTFSIFSSCKADPKSGSDATHASPSSDAERAAAVEKRKTLRKIEDAKQRAIPNGARLQEKTPGSATSAERPTKPRKKVDLQPGQANAKITRGNATSLKRIDTASIRKKIQELKSKRGEIKKD